jgi:hypothetical protein
MPLDRDDADERIARLEQLMRDARAKSDAAGPPKPIDVKNRGRSAPVKATSVQTARTRRRLKKP